MPAITCVHRTSRLTQSSSVSIIGRFPARRRKLARRSADRRETFIRRRLSEVVLETDLRRDLLGSGYVAGVAELVLPKLDREINVRLMRGQTDHLPQIQLDLRP